jgi:hypothetical protein
MKGFLENKIYRNGSTILKAKAYKGDKVLFARLNGDGSEFDYVMGSGVVFDGDNVSWLWGTYPMHHDWEKAEKLLRG